ncbi:MAG TPA: protein kinase [Chroococcales cyanobacterium]
MPVDPEDNQKPRDVSSSENLLEKAVPPNIVVSGETGMEQNSPGESISSAHLPHLQEAGETMEGHVSSSVRQDHTAITDGSLQEGGSRRSTGSNTNANTNSGASGIAEEDYIGTIVAGRYRIISLIGQGGMGSVFKAQHIMLDSMVAVKILNSNLAGDERALKRFAQEAKATNSLSHPNLAAVSDYGLTESGAPYFVMEFVEGESLGSLIEEAGHLEWRRALQLTKQISDAMAYAHLKGVVHRDLKPANVLIARDEKGEEKAVVVDFGIAKVIAEESQSAQRLTQTGEVFGSPLYMSPEQCTGATLDGRSDIYSLGCLLYEAITGMVPFYGDNPVQTILQQIHDAPPSFKTVAKGVETPSGVETITMHCLEKAPADRYQSMEDVSSDLDLVMRGKPPTKKSVRRLHLGTKPLSLVQVATATVLFTFITFGALVWWNGFGRMDAYPWLKDDFAARKYLEHGDYGMALMASSHGYKLAKEKGGSAEEISHLKLLQAASYQKLALTDPTMIPIARTAFETAYFAARERNFDRHRAEACEGRADLELLNGSPQQARQLYDEAIKARESRFDADGVRLRLKEAAVCEKLHDLEGAQKILQELTAREESLGFAQKPALAQAWKQLGDILSQSDAQAAAKAYDRARAIVEEFGADQSVLKPIVDARARLHL